jgi:hypothetical protein
VAQLTPPVGPVLLSPFSFFCRPLTGGARPSGLPLPPIAGQPRAPFMAAGRFWLGLLCSITFKPLQSLCSEAGLHSPLQSCSLPLLNPTLDCNQGRMAIDGHGRREQLPLPSRAYISTSTAPAAPSFANTQAPALPRPCTCTATDRSSCRRAIAAARASPPLVKYLGPFSLASSLHLSLNQASN